jgi:hypothetical protein
MLRACIVPSWGAAGCAPNNGSELRQVSLDFYIGVLSTGVYSPPQSEE